MRRHIAVVLRLESPGIYILGAPVQAYRIWNSGGRGPGLCISSVVSSQASPFLPCPGDSGIRSGGEGYFTYP